MKIEFLKGVYSPEEYKTFNLPEFAFCGRSNVGKSSLINALFQCKIAHTSKKPGKTRCINFFKVENSYIIADLPGYGYAEVSKKMQDDWKVLIEHYITSSQCLKKVFILVDVKRGLEQEELQLIDWLQFNKKIFRIVMTKIDKISKNELALAKKRVADYSPIFFSSVTKEGKKELQSDIREALCI